MILCMLRTGRAGTTPPLVALAPGPRLTTNTYATGGTHVGEEPREFAMGNDRPIVPCSRLRSPDRVLHPAPVLEDAPLRYLAVERPGDTQRPSSGPIGPHGWRDHGASGHALRRPRGTANKLARGARSVLTSGSVPATPGQPSQPASSMQ